MRIKFEVPRGLRQGQKKRKTPYHYWLMDEQPRKVSRLAQLNKSNTRKRTERGQYRGPRTTDEVFG